MNPKERVLELKRMTKVADSKIVEELERRRMKEDRDEDEERKRMREYQKYQEKRKRANRKKN